MTKLTLPLLLLLATLALLGAGWVGLRLEQRLAALEGQVAATNSTLAAVQQEVTRIRVESRAEGQGPRALLAKVRHYAPLLASARTPQPDFTSAKKEMEAILVALGACGKDAWAPLVERFDAIAVSGDKVEDGAIEECKYLLQAGLRIDEKTGKELLKQVLLGHRKPLPRLRWIAADVLIQQDKQLAQTLLRQILLTESCRGINPDRAAAYNLPALDQAAIATSGFDNFVGYYIRSEDPEVATTLLQVLGRNENDLQTIQECVKELGRRKSRAAVERIQELFHRPPAISDNAIFLNYCVDAIAGILGGDARGWLEQELKAATNPSVAQHIQTTLQQL